MSCCGINRKIQSIQYASNRPAAYLAFVPIGSLVIYKLQLLDILPISRENPSKENAGSRRFSDLVSWHLRGSLVQVLSTVLVVKCVALPAFAALSVSLLGFLACYQMVDLMIKSAYNPQRFYEFDSSGNTRRIVMQSTFFF